MSEERKKEEEDKVGDVAVRREADLAIARAEEVLDAFDVLYEDPEKRRKRTVPSGILLGSALGNLSIGSNASTPEERLDQTQKGFTTAIEILFGAMLGYNARMKKGK